MFFLFFGGIVVVGLIVLSERDSGHSCRLPFPHEADYFSRLRKTEQELDEVQERAFQYCERRW